MNRYKKLISAIFFSTAIINLTACGGSGSSDELNTPPPSTKYSYEINKSEDVLHNTNQQIKLTLSKTKKQLSSSLTLMSDNKDNIHYSLEGQCVNDVKITKDKVTLGSNPTKNETVYIIASVNGAKVAQTPIYIRPFNYEVIDPSKYKNHKESDFNTRLVVGGNTKNVSFTDKNYILTEDTNLYYSQSSYPEWFGESFYDNKDLRKLMIYNITSSDLGATLLNLTGPKRGSYYNIKTNKNIVVPNNFYNCMVVQSNAKQLSMPINKTIDLNQFKNTNTNEMHVSITPYHDNRDSSCRNFSSKNWDHITADYYDIYLVNILKSGTFTKVKNNELQCVIKGNDKFNCPKYKNIHFEIDTTDKKGYVQARLVGPLYDWFHELSKKNDQQKIHIQVKTPDHNESESNAILNADVFSFWVSTNSLNAPDNRSCKNFLNSTDDNKYINTTAENISYLKKFRELCKNLTVRIEKTNDIIPSELPADHKEGIPSWTTSRQIQLDGPGILSQDASKIWQFQNDYAKDANKSIASIGVTIMSDQVLLSSQYHLDDNKNISDFADNSDISNLEQRKNRASIIVNGITVDADGGITKETSNIRLNYNSSWNENFADKPSDNNTNDYYTANDYPVYFHNVTQVGLWNEKDDAAAINGRYSIAENNFFQSGDDNLKTMADGVYFKDTTIISGRAGSPIMLGQYGNNRGEEGVTINNTYIIRMNQHESDDTSIWDGIEGIISTHAKNYGASNDINLYYYQSHNAAYHDSNHVLYKNIQINNVYKLTTPGDYSSCNRNVALEHYGSIKDKDGIPVQSGFEDITFNNIPSDNLCWHATDIDGETSDNIWINHNKIK